LASAEDIRKIQVKASTEQTKEQILNHPIIQNIQKNFKGKIHNISEIKEERKT